MSDELWLPHFQAIIWNLLEAHPGYRPTMAEVATHLDLSTLELRRSLHRKGGPSFRVIRAWCCLEYGLYLASGGTKVEAAILLAGYKSYSNFNRCSKQFLGCVPSQVKVNWITVPPGWHKTPVEPGASVAVIDHRVVDREQARGDEQAAERTGERTRARRAGPRR